MPSGPRPCPTPRPRCTPRRRPTAKAAALAAACWLGVLTEAATRAHPSAPGQRAETTAASTSTGFQAAAPRLAGSPVQAGSPPDTTDLQPFGGPDRQRLLLLATGACGDDALDRLLRDRSPLNRFEVAAALDQCLPQPGSETDQQKALIEAFSAELALLRARRDSLQARLVDLEALEFSTTTHLKGEATFVLGANRFAGSAQTLVNESRRTYGASTLNYDLKLVFDTSFTGKDLLRMRLRAGNFDRNSNSFYGAGPTVLSELEVAFQEQSGPDLLGVNRLYYQRPIGDFTFTLGPKVEQDAMLAIWPSVYPASSVLDVMAFAGAIGALNLNLGAGAGLWWQKNGVAISVNTIAANGEAGNPRLGGLASGGSGTSSSLQIGYQARQWAVAATASWLQNGFGTIPYGTAFVLNSFQSPGSTLAYGLSGYWQPLRPGWMPSISAGFGLNTTRYDQPSTAGSLVGTSQSWSVGVQWLKAIAGEHSLGFAVGQPTYATRLVNGASADDGNWVWEGWTSIALSDHLSLTPAVFYLSRPLGANTPSGRSFQQLGVLIKTSLRF